MKRVIALAALTLAPALAQAPATTLIPREKVRFTCTDTYFKSQRENFLLLDETYASCTLSLPLALRQRWPGPRTYYVIPRVSASLHSKNSKGEGQWQPLAPLVNPGPDRMHRALDSRGYEAIELTAKLGKLTDTAGQNTPDTVSTGGKLTVCAAPVYRGEEPCKTFDVAARFKVYTR